MSNIGKIQDFIDELQTVEKENAELKKLHQELHGNAQLVVSAVTSGPLPKTVAAVQCPGELTNFEATVLSALAIAITDSSNKLATMKKTLAEVATVIG
jgi:hypothetical protein